MLFIYRRCKLLGHSVYSQKCNFRRQNPGTRK